MLTRGFVIQKTLSIAAGGSSDNVLQGTRLNPVIANGFVSVWMTAAVETLSASLQVQSDNIFKNAKLPNTAKFCERDRDWVILDIPVSKGDVIEFEISSTDAAAQDANYVVEFRPANRGPRRR